ncbi:spore coat protein [Jeotgalibacillus salarius]|uniref:Spore coat protein n=1 Tax=Jeotgalibacillus salarius TaxID=546023 RepID=A0A4Y8LN35_9BACL|nr:spore coat protein [Jeotgalibacillus salarius]TFE03827.1 spore coat protein [Jeotgalibacillus salarius]
MQDIQQHATMSEKDWATDLLILEKHLAVSYSVASNEASTNQLFQFLQSLLNETGRQQHTLYSFMAQQNWYNPAQETPVNIQAASSQAQADKSQLPVH